jgi:hypothetical protein
MGCDIHSFAEVKKDGKWQRVMEPHFKDWDGKLTTEPFAWRSYGIFAFLADVRNYSIITPLSEPKGLPADSEWLNSPHQYAYENNPMNGAVIPYKERETNLQDISSDYDYHSHSWLTLKELTDFDYSKTFEDRRYAKTTINKDGGKFVDGRALANEGEGEKTTYRNFLGSGFFQDIAQLQTMGAPDEVRIVFWFDN